MCWDFKFTVKNQNLPKCRIVADFFYETPIRAFFRGFQTNCTTRAETDAMTTFQMFSTSKSMELVDSDNISIQSICSYGCHKNSGQFRS